MIALWQHQKDALTFALKREGTLLGHEMGTGKTATAISILEARKAKLVLVMTPKSVVGVWPSQLIRHGSGWLATRLDSGGVAAKAATAQKILQPWNRNNPTAIIINHESVWREPFRTLALKTKWDAIVVDECHRSKSPNGMFSRFLSLLGKRMGGNLRLGLTGTPMPHSPLDIYAQARWIDPTIHGTSFVRFRSNYAIMGGYEGREVVGYENMDLFEKKLSLFCHRVRKQDVLDLPPEVDEVRYCQLEPSAMKIYRQLEKNFIAELGEGVITAANALVKLLRLQQLTGGMLQEDGAEHPHEVSSAKQSLLADILGDCEMPVVVFCKFIADLNAVHHVASKLKLRSGEISSRRKDLTPEATMPENIDVLAVQIHSGGVGIDLSRSATAIYYSTGFDMGDYLQSKSRLHRQGQTRKVTYMHPLAEHTVDEQIYKALEKREALVEGVLEQLRARQEGR